MRLTTFLRSQSLTHRLSWFVFAGVKLKNSHHITPDKNYHGWDARTIIRLQVLGSVSQYLPGLGLRGTNWFGPICLKWKTLRTSSHLLTLPSPNPEMHNSREKYRKQIPNILVLVVWQGGKGEKIKNQYKNSFLKSYDTNDAWVSNPWTDPLRWVPSTFQPSRAVQPRDEPTLQRIII